MGGKFVNIFSVIICFPFYASHGIPLLQFLIFPISGISLSYLAFCATP
jgi:hypothetical protein